MTIRNLQDNYDEIDLNILYKLIIKLIKRNSISFFSISLTLFVGLMLHIFSLKPIFIGANNLYFDDENNISKKFIINFLRSSNPEKPIDLVLSTDVNHIMKNENKILNSSFEEITSTNLRNGKEELSYKEFIENLEIKNIPESNMINISYKNHDKELVLNSLKMISNSYLSFAQEANSNDLENLSFFYKLNKLPLLSKNEEFINKKLKIIKNSQVIFIENPPILKEQLHKNKNSLIILGLISSFFIPLIILLFKEKLIGNIYTFDLNLINCKFIHSIPSSQKSISKNLLKNIFSKIDPKEFIGIIYADSLFLKNEPTLKKFINNERKNIINIDISNQEKINKCDHFFIVLQDGNCKYNDIDLINNCMPLLKGKIIGWILFN